MERQRSNESSWFYCFKSRLIWAPLLLILLANGADCLMCYQCATSGINSPTAGCINDEEGMLDTYQGLNKDYAHDCTDTNTKYTRCMIQTAESAGLTTFFHRGCHDGRTFAKEFNSSRFYGLEANNQSTCDFIPITKKIVCYRFCTTDYCNGPKIPPEEPTICEQYEADPYSVTIPPDVNCTAVGIHPHNGPVGMQLLAVALTSLFMMAFLGAS